jgi:natural product biosynthesis luciferase-like monooxygenase protein
MHFSIMFFASGSGNAAAERYDLILDIAVRSERMGFSGIWLPERHFDSFGAIFPNPCLLLSALAARTERIQLRAGSLVSPLHDTIRVFEDWSVLDHLSRGRCSLSFGSGWNVNDFVFFPDVYQQRRQHMWLQIEEIRAMWRGEPVLRRNGAGQRVEVRPLPRPWSASPDIWTTSSGQIETIREAGRQGAKVLTHLIGKDADHLARSVKAYRGSLDETGRCDHAHFALMLHTCVAPSDAAALSVARVPLKRYLRSAIALDDAAARSGGGIGGGLRGAPQDLDSEIIDELLELSVERYLDLSLIGSPERCRRVIETMASIGIDEIACLIDFGPSDEAIMESLELLSGIALRGEELVVR